MLYQKIQILRGKLFNQILKRVGIIIGCQKNPNITYQIVQENPEKGWNYDNLSRHPNITWEIVQENPDKPWDYNYLSENPNITWEIVQSNPDKGWNYYALSKNPNITYGLRPAKRQIIQENPESLRDAPQGHKHWNYNALSQNTFNCRKYNWIKKLHKYYSKKIKGEFGVGKNQIF